MVRSFSNGFWSKAGLNYSRLLKVEVVVAKMASDLELLFEAGAPMSIESQVIQIIAVNQTYFWTVQE